MIQTKNIDNGLNHEGFIVNPCKVEYITPDYRKLIDDLLCQLQTCLGDKLHSVYLYGSVARGEARQYQSDLDLSLVFNQELTEQEQHAVKGIQRTTEQRYDLVTKIDFDPGIIHQVLLPEEKYRWHFWLKHCCCCIYGEDLSRQFAWQKPSLAIAYALNGDLSDFLQQRLGMLNYGSAARVGREVAKKILRTVYTIIAVEHGSWYVSLDDIIAAIRTCSLPCAPAIEAIVGLWQTEQPTQERIAQVIQRDALPIVKWVDDVFAPFRSL